MTRTGTAGEWSLDLLRLELRGFGLKVDLSLLRDTRAIYSCLAEAAEIGLEDEALASLVREITALLPPCEVVNRPARLGRGDIQAVVLWAANRRDRPRRRNARPPVFIAEAP